MPCNKRIPLILFLLGMIGLSGFEVRASIPSYDIGDPVLTDIWVDPVHGSDTSDGTSRDRALRTLSEAWGRIPEQQDLAATGYRIRLTAGTYPPEEVPGYMESRWGTYACPVILESADGRGSAILPPLNIFDCNYLYLIDLAVRGESNNVIHFEQGRHILLRRCTVTGADPDTWAVQEVVKMNQSEYIYVEDCDVSGAWNPALDFVSVHYGHIVRSRFHNAGDWCLYLKGGSAYFIVEGNIFYDCFTGGFSAGQGAGFEFMESPWLHYEATDIKFVNNIVHHAYGAGFGVHGGYNILIAYNTLYHVGDRSHGLEFVHGERSCDGDTAACSERLAAGGWGTDRPDDTQYIPSRHVYVYNNVLYNPDGVQSPWDHFWIEGPVEPASYSNIPSPSVCDEDLEIRGNILWNGPSDLPLGVEEESQGCRPDNPTCNAVQLRADNAINTVRPQLKDPENGDFHPTAGGTLFFIPAIVIPDFSGGDRPQPPLAPEGDLVNFLDGDFNGSARPSNGPPGAYAYPTSSHQRPLEKP